MRVLLAVLATAVGLAASTASADASFSATLNGRTIFVNGTTGPDHLIVKPKSNDNGVLDFDLDGNGQGDSLFAKDGFDHIEISAGAGDDVVSMTGTSKLTTRVFAGSGDDQVTGGVANDHFLGGPGKDRLQGNSSDDWMEGEGDDDEIVWGSFEGDDVIDGGPGQDRFFYNGFDQPEHVTGGVGAGGALHFTADGPASADATSIEGAQIPLLGGADTWEMTSPLPFQPLIQGGPGNDRLTGSDGSETLVGDQDSDVVDGRGGDDIVEDFFGGGLDSIQGGAGEDRLVSFGTGGADVFNVAAGAPGHTGISLAGRGASDYAGVEIHFIDAGEGDDIVRTSGEVPALRALGRAGNDTLEGGSGDDTLIGNEGDDKLDGKAGADSVNGGAGTDALTGGPGIDTFSCGGIGDTLVDLAAEDVLKSDCGERPAPAPTEEPPAPQPQPGVEQQPAPPAGPSAPAPVPAATCVVPKLKKLTLAKAKKRLTKAHCRLGKVSKPRGKGRGKLVVKRQSTKPGAVRPAHAKVAVRLVRKH